MSKPPKLMPTGIVSKRLWLYSADEDDNPIPKIKHHGIKPKAELRPTPNSTHGLENKQQISRAVDRLTTEEMAVLRLHREVQWVWKERAVAAKEVDDLVRSGYSLINGSRNIVGNMFPVSLTYQQIGDRIGLSSEQVHSRIKSANRKIKGK